jgi:UDP-N-acetylmuramoyl-L-alanyl-D-glutamate--2,6-diaminopimelate ligase
MCKMQDFVPGRCRRGWDGPLGRERLGARRTQLRLIGRGPVRGKRDLQLKELATALTGVLLAEGIGEQEVTGLAADSRQVKPGDLFVSITGGRIDATQYVGDAVAKGAVAVVAQRPVAVPAGVGLIVVENARLALSALADRFWGSPWRKLKTVGITGTNGKTTTAFLIKQMGMALDHLTGVIGTAGNYLGDVELEAKSGYTTPEAHNIHRALATMVAKGGEAVAMEVSSHALEQHRADHIQFDVAVFTNLTHEHLDYHKTMEAYFEAKAKLFRMLRPGAVAVINLDDPWGERLVSVVPTGVQVLTYGFHEKAAVRAVDLVLSPVGARYRVISPVGEVAVEAPGLFGTYNVSNALAALAACMGLGWGLARPAAALAKAVTAPGRFERIDLGQPFHVIVDYAHTPDGFEKLLSDVVKVKEPGARVIVVFGSAGHRDQTKRPTMGQVAGDFGDILVLTEEDPRTESALQICEQIAAGVRRPGVQVEIIEDRVDAIDRALHLAQPHDVVLVLGKGRETELEVNHPTRWIDDVTTTTDLLRALLAERKEEAL